MKKVLSIALLAALLIGCAAVPAVADESDGSNWLRLFLTADPETLDVQLTTDSYSIPLNCFDRLVETETIDGEAKLVPGLADDWKISEDGLTYTFYLHQGVTFQNGDPFTADDVVYTVNRMMDPATLAKNTDIYSVVVGAMDFYEGKADSVSGVTAIDDYTVQFTLESAYAPFLSCLATPGGSIYNRESTEPAGTDFGVDPAVCFGTGPFQVTEWVLGSKVTLVSNPNYFKGAPAIDGITFYIVPDADTQRNKFINGEVDVFNFDYAESQLDWFKDNGYADQIISGTRAGVYYFMMNTGIEPLNNVNVRKAIQMAIPRKEILTALYGDEGSVLDTFIPVGILGHTDDVPEIAYDPDGARELLNQAGYADGFDMEIAVMTDSQTSLKVSTLIAGFLKRVGIRAEVRQYDESTYYAVRRDGELPSYYNSWSADFNDPDNFLYTFFSNKNTVGRSINYDNAQIMELLDQARVMVNMEERLAAYQTIDNAVVHEDAICLPLFQRNHLFCVNPRVKGFKVAWNGWSDMSYYGITIE